MMTRPKQRHSFRDQVRRSVKGLATLDEVHAGAKHLIADIIAKDPDTLHEMRRM